MIMTRRFGENQTEVLRAAFEESDCPTREKKAELVAATGLDVEQVTSWFSRRRARKRTRETAWELEQAHSRLQQALRLSRGREAELQRELEESRRREAALLEENQELKRRVTIAEGDRQFEALIMRFMNGAAKDPNW